MKICEVISSLKGRGGAEVFLISLACEIKKHNDELYLICLYDGIDPEFKRIIDKNNIEIYFCGKEKGFCPKSNRNFKKIIKSINPDIIHLHLSCLSTYYFAFGSRTRKWKILETIHSVPGKFLSRTQELIRKKFIKRKNIFFVGISNIISNQMETKYGCYVKTIYNGISLPIMEFKNINKRKYDFIIVASFSYVKNHKLLFDCFKL